MIELLAMGKYGAYVWSSYALAAFVVVTCVVQARRRHRRVLWEISRRLQLEEPGQ